MDPIIFRVRGMEPPTLLDIHPVDLAPTGDLTNAVISLFDLLGLAHTVTGTHLSDDGKTIRVSTSAGDDLYLDRDTQPTLAMQVAETRYGTIVVYAAADRGGSIETTFETGADNSSEPIAIATDTIESLVLALACEGVRINTPQCIRAIETAMNVAETQHADNEATDAPSVTTSKSIGALDEPLSKAQIEHQWKADKHGRIKGVVRVELDDLIGKSLESVLDILSERLTGTEVLSDTSYAVVGIEGETTLLVEVCGEASMVLEILDEGEDPACPECKSTDVTPLANGGYHCKACDATFGFSDIELPDGSVIEAPESDSGVIRVRDIHGNTSDIYDPSQDRPRWDAFKAQYFPAFKLSDGTNGQDRESYSDEQDRENYTTSVEAL